MHMRMLVEDAYIPMNGISIVSKHIMLILGNNRKAILQRWTLKQFLIMIYWLQGSRVNRFLLRASRRRLVWEERLGLKIKTQGTLFFDVCRILKEKRPKAFMLENVKNLKSHDKGRTFKTILESLDELKYKVFFAVLDGQNFVPQHRERIIIVGFDMERYGDDIEFDFDITPVNPKPVMRDILEKKVDDKYTLSDNLWTYLQNYAAKHRAAGNGFGYGIAPLDGVSRTISARYHKDGSEILIAQKGKNPRRLTPRECARLQGFPESFVIPVSDTQAYRQFGNSVVVPLIENVAKLIVEKIDLLESDVQNVKRKAI